jgi:formate dehydrogenase beta subunit
VQVGPGHPDDRGAGHLRRGDAVPSQRTVTVGVGHGKRAARAIDAWLRGDAVHRAPKHPLASLDQLNLWYFGVHDRREEAVLDPRPGR